jgi:two-component system sensor histidine kinase KdpD
LKDALLAAVSHDLRTPLTAIKGIAHEIALRGDDDAMVIEEEADRLASLVEGLLELSQLDAGAPATAVAINTVDDLIGAALQRARAVLSSHDLHVDLGNDALLVGTFDFSQSVRVLVNLLENAAKYSPPGTAIEMAARRAPEGLLITVADRGRGVPEAEHERIFQPFYRVPGAQPDVRGAGLGLSIARGLARAQHGDLTVASHPGGGSVFTLRLPAAELPTG